MDVVGKTKSSMAISNDNSPLEKLSILFNRNSIDDQESNVSSLIKRKLSIKIEAFQKSRPPTQKNSIENVVNNVH